MGRCSGPRSVDSSYISKSIYSAARKAVDLTSHETWTSEKLMQLVREVATDLFWPFCVRVRSVTDESTSVVDSSES